MEKIVFWQKLLPGPDKLAVSFVQLNYRLFAGATFCSACSKGQFSLAGKMTHQTENIIC